MSGTLFIVAAPSGAGKTSLVRELIRADAQLRLSVSFTTRSPRPGETDGRDYHFVTVAQFEGKIAAGDFLESAQVHGNYYGTARSMVATELAADRDVILEIDWQGARQVRLSFPDACSVFILPPSRETLQTRLNNRGQDSSEVIAKRMRNAVEEMRHCDEFDFIVINDAFDVALAELKTLISACRLLAKVQLARHSELVSRLVAELA
jgi:guanylate kinase